MRKSDSTLCLSCITCMYAARIYCGASVTGGVAALSSDKTCNFRLSHTSTCASQTPRPPPFALLRASNYHCKSHTLLQLMSISQPSRPLTLNFTNLFSLYSLRILRRLLFVWLSYLFIDINCYLFTLINIFYIFFYY